MQEDQKKLRLPYTKSSGPYANVECKARTRSNHTYYTALVITTIRTFDVVKSIDLTANRCIGIIE